MLSSDKSHYPDLPTGWELVRLGEVCNSVLGKMLDAQKNKGNYKPYLRNINVRWGCFDLDDLLEMRFENSENERYAVRHGDLIVCEGGEPGRCAVWKYPNTDMMLQKALHRVRPFCGISADCLSFIIRHYAQTTFLENYFTGSTIKHLTGQSLSSLIIPLPPLAEQKRIIATIDASFVIIDEIETHKGDLLSAVTAAKQKVLSLAISGKLVPQDENDEPASVLLDRIQAERNTLASKGKVKKSIATPTPITTDSSHYGDLPTSWVFTRLGAIVDLVGGISYDKDDVTDSGIRILRGGNIQDGKILYAEDDVFLPQKYFDAEKIVRETDAVIVASTGSKLVIGKAGFLADKKDSPQIGAFLRIVRPKIEALSGYLKIILISNNYREYIREIAKGTNINNIKSEYITEFHVPLPPLAEQARIVAAVEAAFEQLDEIVRVLN